MSIPTTGRATHPGRRQCDHALAVGTGEQVNAQVGEQAAGQRDGESYKRRAAEGGVLRVGRVPWLKARRAQGKPPIGNVLRPHSWSTHRHAAQSGHSRIRITRDTRRAWTAQKTLSMATRASQASSPMGRTHAMAGSRNTRPAEVAEPQGAAGGPRRTRRGPPGRRRAGRGTTSRAAGRPGRSAGRRRRRARRAPTCGGANTGAVDRTVAVSSTRLLGPDRRGLVANATAPGRRAPKQESETRTAEGRSARAEICLEDNSTVLSSPVATGEAARTIRLRTGHGCHVPRPISRDGSEP